MSKVKLETYLKLNMDRERIMNNLEQILLSVITSGITAIIVVFLLKTFIERYIEHIFHDKEISQDFSIYQKANANEYVFIKELSVYPEVVEIIYRCRNTARDSKNEKTRSRAVLSEFSQCKFHLTDNLYKYRFFFPNEIFRKLHKFKSEIQEFAVLLDMVTRSENVEDSPVNPEIQEQAKEQLNKKYNIINEISEQLIPEIQELIRNKTKV